MISLSQAQACLGGEWPAQAALNASLHRTRQQNGYRIEEVSYMAEPDDVVPALLLIPDGVDAQHPAPGIAVWHQHNNEWELGKSEPAGLAGDPIQHTGVALVKQGYVVLCPDTLGFEERQHAVLKGKDYEWFLFTRYLVEGKSLAWKNILDARRAVDYLSARPEVQASCLGCYGHSLGSTLTWLLGPFDERLRCLVGNCCLPSYESMWNSCVNHCATNYIPGLARYGDVFDVAALIAPRPFHLNFGETDPLNPIEGVRKSVEVIQQAYQRQHAEKNFTFYIEPGSGHVFSETMWQHTLKTFHRHLRR